MVRELVDIAELRRSSCSTGDSRRAVEVQSCSLPVNCFSTPPRNPLVDRILTLIPGLVDRSSECATRMAIKRRCANHDVQVVDYFVPCDDLLVAEQLWERSVYDLHLMGLAVSLPCGLWKPRLIDPV